MRKLLLIPFAALLSYCSEGDTQKTNHPTNKTKSEQPTKNRWTDKVVAIDNAGWGYQLFRGSHLEINQQNVPAVNGLHYFETESDAEKAAEFVLLKIEQGFFPPTVEPEELDSIGAIDLKAIKQENLKLLQSAKK